MPPRLGFALLAAGLALGGCAVDNDRYYGGRGYPRGAGVYQGEGVRDSDVLVPRRRAVCDPGDRLCYRNGRPNRAVTRDVFGRGAARRMDRWD
jgi:hypothetical protein